MPTLVFVFVLSLLFYAVQAFALRSVPEESLGVQLSRYLTDPVLVCQGSRIDFVLISFRVDARERLTDLRVYTCDQEFNTAVAYHLTGRQINNAGMDSQRTQWVRIRFLPTETGTASR